MKISVIVPVFNGEKYLAATLERAINQNMTQTSLEIELIVVIDGSSDQSEQIAQRYGAKIIHQQNLGPGAARNTGIKHSTGEHLAFLDQDDLWHPDKLRLQLEVLQHGDYAICRSNAQLEIDALEHSSKIRQGYANHAINPTLSALLIERMVFLHVGYFDPQYRTASDTDWFARAKQLGLKAVCPEQTLLRKRFHTFNQGHDTSRTTAELLRVLRASVQRKRNP